MSAASSRARIAWVCLAALLVFAIWVTLNAHPSSGIAFFYAVSVGLAAWWGGWRWGAPAVAGCCGLYVLGAAIHPVPHLGLSLLARLLAFLAVATVIGVLRERVAVLEHSAEELEAIRAALTPSALPELPGVDAAAAFVPSEHGVSGDFYLVTNGPDGSTVAVVGDVVGHGPEAARLATFVRARFAAFAADVSDPAELLALANRALVERAGGSELISAVCLRLRDAGTLSWAIAGHPPPLRIPALDALAAEGGTFLLGAREDLLFRNAEISLGEAEGVVAYTDGVTDLRRGRALLGPEGLARVLAPLTELPAGAIVARAEEALLEWADRPIRDDLCVLVLKPKPAGA